MTKKVILIFLLIISVTLTFQGCTLFSSSNFFSEPLDSVVEIKITAPNYMGAALLNEEDKETIYNVLSQSNFITPLNDVEFEEAATYDFEIIITFSKLLGTMDGYAYLKQGMLFIFTDVNAYRVSGEQTEFFDLVNETFVRTWYENQRSF